MATSLQTCSYGRGPDYAFGGAAPRSAGAPFAPHAPHGRAVEHHTWLREETRMDAATATGTDVEGVTVLCEFDACERVLTPEALGFVAKLHRRFNPRRAELLRAREERQLRIDNGELPAFLAETEHVRRDNWRVGPTPPDLEQRWVEITGPVEVKMMINALNSGASCFLADF